MPKKMGKKKLEKLLENTIFPEGLVMGVFGNNINGNDGLIGAVSWSFDQPTSDLLGELNEEARIAIVECFVAVSQLATIAAEVGGSENVAMIMQALGTNANTAADLLIRAKAA